VGLVLLLFGPLALLDVLGRAVDPEQREERFALLRWVVRRVGGGATLDTTVMITSPNTNRRYAFCLKLLWNMSRSIFGGVQ